jgi:hypothetical protein
METGEILCMYVCVCVCVCVSCILDCAGHVILSMSYTKKNHIYVCVYACMYISEPKPACARKHVCRVHINMCM